MEDVMALYRVVNSVCAACICISLLPVNRAVTVFVEVC